MNACLAKGDKVFLFNNRVDADGTAGYGDAGGAPRGPPRPSRTTRSSSRRRRATCTRSSRSASTPCPPPRRDRGPLLLRGGQGHQLGRLGDGRALDEPRRRRQDGDGQRPGPREQIRMSHLNLPSVGVTMAQKIGLQMVVKFDTPSERESRPRAVLGPRPLQRGQLRVLRGLHGRQLQPPVRARVLDGDGPLPPRPAAFKSGRLSACSSAGARAVVRLAPSEERRWRPRRERRRRCGPCANGCGRARCGAKPPPSSFARSNLYLTPAVALPYNI